MKKLILNRTLFFVFFAGIVWGQIPQTMSYQGILKTSSGTVVTDGNYQLAFNIYDVSTSGTTLWTETHATVAVSDGVFNVILGSITSLNLAFDEQYWLGVTVSTDSELSPRVKLTASPYSLNAQAVLGSSNTFPSDGNVGIGTTSPGSAKLLVRTSATANVPDANTVALFEQTGDPSVNIAGTSSAALKLYTGNRYDGGLSIDASTRNLSFYSGGTGPNLTVTSAGNVGIGTTTPAQKLDVAGMVSMSGFTLTTIPTSGFVLTSDAGGIGTWQAAASGVGGSGTTNYLPKFTASSTLGNSVIYESSGNVGIGTTSPTGQLEIEKSLTGSGTSFFGQNIDVDIADGTNQTGNLTGLDINLTNAGTSNFNSGVAKGLNVDISGLTGSGTKYAGIFQGGNVGIGTTNPSYNLDIQDSNGAVIRIKGTGTALGTSLIIDRSASSTDGNLVWFTGGTPHWRIMQFGGDSDGLRVREEAGGAYLTRMYFKTGGNVGIGTTSPSYKLDVAGNFNLSSGSTFKINGTDILSASSLGSGVTGSSLTSVGTLTSGTWNASTIGVAYGGTGLSTFGGTNTILYTTAADALAGITSVNSGVLVTNGSGVPSLATDIPTAVTIGSKYVYRADGTDVAVADGGTGAGDVSGAKTNLGFMTDLMDDTSPQLAGMLDVNLNAIGDGTLELLKFSETASAVNELTVKNAATGGAPEIQATGGDTDIDLELIPKGTGVLSVAGTTNYESNISAGDDIPNKQWIDDQGFGVGSGDITAVGDAASGDAFTADGTGNSLTFEGTTANSNEIALVGADPGADVTVTIPATTGTLYISGGSDVAVADGGTGASSFTSSYLVKGNGTSALSSSLLYDNGTNVGIGTTSPTKKLDVNGAGYFSGDLRVEGNLGVHTDPVEGGNNNIFLYDEGTYSNPNIQVSGHNSGSIVLMSRRVDVTSGKNWTIKSGFGAVAYLDMFSIYNSDDGYCFVIRNGGNVGIGTTSPAKTLDVAGDVNISSGSAYGINGTDVLSGSALGSGITASSLTSVGTLTSGTWNATAVGVAYGGTGAGDASGAKTNLGFITDLVDDTSPQLAGMLDVNGNAIGNGTLELLKFSETASAVNELTVKNAATGGAPEVQATGGDANIDLELIPKGTGVLSVAGTTNYESNISAGDDIPNKQWIDDQGFGTGSGDITAVGDMTTGAAFTATAGNDGNSLYFEGSTSDGNEVLLTAANPGSDVTVTIPASTGTLYISGGTDVAVADGGTGASSFTSSYLVKGNGTSALSSSLLYDNGTNVGIGTASPGNLLHISADDATAGGVTDMLRIEHTTTGTAANGIGAGVTFHIEDTGGSEEQGSIDVVMADVTDGGMEDASMNFSVRKSGTITEIMRVDGAIGGVGIGTASPGNKLHISADDANASGVTDMMRIEHTTTGTAAAGLGSGITFYIEDGGGSEEQASIDVVMTDVANGIEDAYMNFKVQGSGTVSEIMRLDGLSGGVGIGTTSPAQKLDVAGTAQMSGFKLTTTPTSGYVLTSDASGVGTWQAATGGVGGSGTTNYLPKFTGSTTLGNSLIYESSSSLGIGTTSPGDLLHISVDDDSASGVTDLLRIEHTTNGTAASGIGAGITFHVEDAGGSEEQGSIDVILDDVSDASEDATMTFKINKSGTMTEVMRIDGTSGNVGIGTTSPSEKLYVAGNISLSGQIKMGDGSSVNRLDVNSSGGVSISNTTAYSRTTAPTGGLIVSGNVGIGTASPNSKLEINGTFATTAIRTESGNYTATSTDYIILASTTSGQIITLPTAVGIAGRRYIIKKTGSDTVSVNIYVVSPQTIDGSTSDVISTQWAWMEVISDGANWLKIGFGG